MRFDETRDNTTDIENQIIEADKRAREESAPYPPAYPFPVFGDDPEHDPIGDAETEYDIELINPVEHFNLSEIPEQGVRSVDVFNAEGQRLFSITVSTDGVAYQVLPYGEGLGLFTTTDDEV